ncbi:MAG TPA: hypothetical protein VL588_02075, partial [Bdellovibrionota bacterium]|nr:hypothetical protein [Bdellovibrionota bacterium]
MSLWNGKKLTAGSAIAIALATGASTLAAPGDEGGLPKFHLPWEGGAAPPPSGVQPSFSGPTRPQAPLQYLPQDAGLPKFQWGEDPGAVPPPSAQAQAPIKLLPQDAGLPPFQWGDDVPPPSLQAQNQKFLPQDAGLPPFDLPADWNDPGWGKDMLPPMPPAPGAAETASAGALNPADAGLPPMGDFPKWEDMPPMEPFPKWEEPQQVGGNQWAPVLPQNNAGLLPNFEFPKDETPPAEEAARAPASEPLAPELTPGPGTENLTP